MAYWGKAMVTHSSTLAWKIPWTEEPGRLQSMGSLSWTRLSDFTFTFHFHAVQKEMATRPSVLAWRIPETGEPAGLPSTYGVPQSRTRLKWLSSSSSSSNGLNVPKDESVLQIQHVPNQAYFPHPTSSWFSFYIFIIDNWNYLLSMQVSQSRKLNISLLTSNIQSITKSFF